MNGINLGDANFDIQSLDIDKDKKYVLYLNIHKGDNIEWGVQTLQNVKKLLLQQDLDNNNIFYTLKVDDVPLFEIKEEKDEEKWKSLRTLNN